MKLRENSITLVQASEPESTSKVDSTVKKIKLIAIVSLLFLSLARVQATPFEAQAHVEISEESSFDFERLRSLTQSQHFLVKLVKIAQDSEQGESAAKGNIADSQILELRERLQVRRGAKRGSYHLSVRAATKDEASRLVKLFGTTLLMEVKRQQDIENKEAIEDLDLEIEKQKLRVEEKSAQLLNMIDTLGIKRLEEEKHDVSSQP
ncbi:MAG: hypothetical protein ACQKBY_01280 [Verrucomicrobiales bacterium]